MPGAYHPEGTGQGNHREIHYPIPIHLQKAYESLGYQKGDFPVAEGYAEREVSLPLWVGMSQEKEDKVIKYVNSAI